MWQSQIEIECCIVGFDTSSTFLTRDRPIVYSYISSVGIYIPFVAFYGVLYKCITKFKAPCCCWTSVKLRRSWWGKWKMLKYRNESTEVRRKGRLSVSSALILSHNCVCWGLVAKEWLSPNDVRSRSWDLGLRISGLEMILVCQMTFSQPCLNIWCTRYLWSVYEPYP